jgi:hypothetical protein
MQRLILSGSWWGTPDDSDPVTGHLTGEAGVQYALRIRNACLVAAALADAGISAVVSDTVICEGFESLTEVLNGRPIHFVVLRPPVAVLRQRGIDRLPQEAAYLADGDGDHARPRRSPLVSKPQPATAPSTSSRASSNGASIACHLSDSGSILVASIRRAWRISC